jgi:hypothetical protein
VFVDKDGNYHLDNGQVIPAGEIGKLHQKAPKSESLAPKEKQELAEGQSSGVIRLED